MKQDHYTYQITWSSEDNEYVGLCLEFPSLSWLTESKKEALQGIRQLVDDIMLDITGSGKPVPEPLVISKRKQA